jgi:hypothetical protein
MPDAYTLGKETKSEKIFRPQPDSVAGPRQPIDDK